MSLRVKERTTCCLLACPELGEVNCQKDAEWVIWDGLEPAYDHTTYACTAHVGYLLCDTPEMHRVYPVEWEEIEG